MTDFRAELETSSKKLVKRFSLPMGLPYSYARKNQLTDAWGEFVSNEADVDVRADLTFKQVREVPTPPLYGHLQTTNRVFLTYALAVANIGQFCERLNYACYKHAYKRYGKRLNVVSAIEGGKEDWRDNRVSTDADKRLHTHLLLQLPSHLPFSDFSALVWKCWFGTDWGYSEGKIQMIKTKYHSAAYNVKSTLDAIDLENTFLTTESRATQ